MSSLDLAALVQNIHYSAEVYSKVQPGNGSSQALCVFSDSRQNPIVANPGNYRLAVERLRVQTSTIPLYIVKPRADQADVDELDMSISLQDNLGNVVTEYIHWVPEFLTATPPSVVDIEQNRKYYHGYSVSHLVRLVNTSIATAMTGLIVLNPGLAGTPSPFFEYDASALRLRLYAPESTFNQATAPTITLWSNQAFNEFFSFFDTDIDETAPVLTYNYNIYPTPTGSNVVPVAGTDYIKVEQEYGNFLQLWNPCQSIVITTTNLPIVAESTSALYVGESETLNTTEQVITDVSPSLSDGTELRTDLTYSPSILRWVEMQGAAPLTTLQFQVYWRDYRGNLIPLELPYNGSASIKICFRTKAAGLSS